MQPLQERAQRTRRTSRLLAATRPPAHGRGAPELRSGLCGVWPQAQALKGAWAVNSARARDSVEWTKDKDTNQRIQTVHGTGSRPG